MEMKVTVKVKAAQVMKVHHRRHHQMIAVLQTVAVLLVMIQMMIQATVAAQMVVAAVLLNHWSQQIHLHHKETQRNQNTDNAEKSDILVDFV